MLAYWPEEIANAASRLPLTLGTVLIEATRDLCIVPGLKFHIELNDLCVGGRAAHGNVDVLGLEANDLVHNRRGQGRFNRPDAVSRGQDLHV